MSIAYSIYHMEIFYAKHPSILYTIHAKTARHDEAVYRRKSVCKLLLYMVTRSENKRQANLLKTLINIL